MSETSKRHSEHADAVREVLMHYLERGANEERSIALDALASLEEQLEALRKVIVQRCFLCARGNPRRECEPVYMHTYIVSGLHSWRGNESMFCLLTTAEAEAAGVSNPASSPRPLQHNPDPLRVTDSPKCRKCGRYAPRCSCWDGPDYEERSPAKEPDA